MTGHGLERRPRDCWDWITPEQVIRHAFAAFYAASRLQSPPPGESFLDDGLPWASRADFRDALAGIFRQRINAQALGLGVTGSSGCVYPDLPEGMVWPDEECGVLGAQPPTDMAQGCAASAVGAGAPRAESPEADESAPDDPLLRCPEGQHLPAEATAGHTQTA
ncbi:hypothetical protein GCM10027359_05060 [Marilutibacter aestuarii]